MNNNYLAIAAVLRNYTMYNAGLDIAVELAHLFHKQDVSFDEREWLKLCDVKIQLVH